jgi:hypothetical protein
MKVSIEKTEHYSSIKIEEDLASEELLKELRIASQNLLEEELWNYILFDFKTEIDLGSDLGKKVIDLVRETNEILELTNGLAISVHANTQWMEKFEDKGLVLVPSESEAVEFIFMDQLEKQFLDDSEEE